MLRHVAALIALAAAADASQCVRKQCKTNADCDDQGGCECFAVSPNPGMCGLRCGAVCTQNSDCALAPNCTTCFLGTCTDLPPTPAPPGPGPTPKPTPPPTPKPTPPGPKPTPPPTPKPTPPPTPPPTPRPTPPPTPKPTPPPTPKPTPAPTTPKPASSYYLCVEGKNHTNVCYPVPAGTKGAQPTEAECLKVCK